MSNIFSSGAELRVTHKQNVKNGSGQKTRTTFSPAVLVKVLCLDKTEINT